MHNLQMQKVITSNKHKYFLSDKIIHKEQEIDSWYIQTTLSFEWNRWKDDPKLLFVNIHDVIGLHVRPE